MNFVAARRILEDAVAGRACPAAVVEAGRRAAPIWQEPFGRLTFDADAPPCAADTIFDLASLTKVIATTTVCMRLVEAGRLQLDAPVRAWVPAWRGADRAAVTVRHLLEHASGLPAHAELFRRLAGAEAFESAICDMPLAYEPGSRSIYSDLGFILLGFILERAGDRSLDDEFASIADHFGDFVGFHPPDLRIGKIAPTENDPWRGRLLRGEVHDENAAALGGVAGHAGLFGTAAAVGAFARSVLTTFREATWMATPALMREFAARTGVPGSSRALGWDTMLPTSSCGTRMSPTAIGHTGFTGTSLWIDWERDLYVVLLTNRVHPSRDNAALAARRPAFHDALVSALPV
jgi:CubicO group peptidase (beta-lactamase class C family)